jgi:hypothetical protein
MEKECQTRRLAWLSSLAWWLTRGSGEQIAKRIAAPPRPAKRLRTLLKGDGN